MRELLLLMTVVALNGGTAFAKQRASVKRTSGVAVAFFDEERLQERPDGQATLETFKAFIQPIQEIVKRDFPNVEFKIVRRGELLRLPDGGGVNVQNIQPELGFILSAPGKKRRILTGPQSEADFACASAVYFHRSSPACPK